MIAVRPNATRIANLLRELEEAKQELWLATDRDHAEAARADIASLKHSLWLAGHSDERAA